MTKPDPSFAWGPRDTLYENHFDYVFSLNVEFEPCIDPVQGVKMPLRAVKTSEDDWNTFHVLGQEFMRTPNGIQQEVPRARLVFGTDAFLIADYGAVSVNGSLLFETDTPDRLSMRYRGVLNLSGGTRSLSDKAEKDVAGPNGTIFIASRQHVVNPKYRWMVLNQLIGIGRVETWGDGRKWILKVDYDLYIAS